MLNRSEGASVVSLTDFLGSTSVEDFVATILESRPLYVQNGAAGLAGGVATILTLDGFERILAGSREGVSVVTAGIARPVDPNNAPQGAHLTQLYAAYEAGNTLLVTGLQTRLDSVASLCRDLELEFLRRGFPLAEAMGANAYLTAARSQGFGIHYDDHCTFIVQLSGAKLWEIFPPPMSLPLNRCAAPIDRQSLGEPASKITVRQGDVLYIPRGFPHVARTDRESSLHVTLSLKIISRAEAIAELVRSNVWFRASLSPQADDSGPGGVALTDALIAEVGKLDIAGYRKRRVAISLARLPPLPSKRPAALKDIDGIGRETRVERDCQVMCISSIEDGQAVLRFPGATVSFDKVLSPVFDFVASVEAFTPNDLPDLEEGTYDTVELTKLLVRHGLAAPSRDAGDVHPNQPAAQRIPDEHDDGGRHGGTPPSSTSRRITFQRRPSGSAIPHLDWLHCPGLLSDDDCDAMIATARAFPLVAPATVDEENLPDHRHADCRHVGLTDQTRWIYQLICDAGKLATESHYQLTLSGITRAPQYVEYRPGRGHFACHNDYSHDQIDSPRKLTVIVQLSEPDDYDGGRLQVFGVDVDELPRSRGSVLVFPSFTYHCVTPVTRGIRRALVAWIAGPRLR